MKHILFFLLFLCSFTIDINAQDTLTLSSPIATGGVIKGCKSVRLQPGFSFTATANNSLALQADVSVCNDQEIPVAASSGQNYIITVTPLGESKSVKFENGNIVVDRTTEGDVPVQVSIQYYDGLGRPSQTVQKGFTPKGHDLVTLQEYDDSGRETNLWLPTPYPGNGSYVDPETIKDASKGTYNDNSPYSFPVYEKSPLNRVLEKYGPGDGWRNGRSVKSLFCTNNNSDSLRCAYYYVTADNKLVKSKTYADCQLYVIRTEDEDGHKVLEFKDKIGQVVLIRQLNGVYNHDTYYVYDDFGNKCFVLPPSAADSLTDNTYAETESILQKFAYIYRYDHRNRCIYKKLPGAEPIHMIYDTADHMIFSQDGEQRLRDEWSFNIPDVFGRTVLTGVFTDKSLNYTAVPLKGIVIKADWAKTTNSYKGYNISGFNLASSTILSVNYYDSYEFMGLNGVPHATDSNFKYETGTGYDEQYTGGYKGLLTGKVTALLDGSSTYLYSVMYYDDKGRVIQTKATGHQYGGIEKDYFSYTFTGKVKNHKHIHKPFMNPTITEVYKNYYDHSERLVKTTHSLNEATPVALMENDYDEMGRLQKKTLYKEVDNISYAYNIRGWLKSIKTGRKLFCEDLYYNESSNGSIPCYNGNISAMNWQLQNETQRGYNFFYDELSRVTAADYQNNESNDKNYSATYSYDKMGNIRTLKRYGLVSKPSSFDVIDDLTMNYNGNQLTNVADIVNPGPLYAGAFNFVDSISSGGEYKYDANGNLTEDLNKKIARIQYNSLNLPSRLQFTQGHTTEYLYDADGVKRSVKQVTTTQDLMVPIGSTLSVPTDKIAVKTQTDYCGNVIYENGTLNKILVDGGYITMSNGTPTYHYYIQDHQGNNRVVFNQTGTIEQTNHYYPFGMTFGEGIENSDQRYKYNGKELERMHGLNLYDYGARHYDAAVGRWGVIDPLAEKYYDVSPYVYCFNNPIRIIDPDGRDGWDVVGGIIDAVIDDISISSRTISSSSTANNESHYNVGQVIGHVLASVIGSAEVIDGGGNMLAGGALAVGGSGTVAAIPVGGAIVAGGAVKAGHGMMVVAKAVNNISKVGSTSGNVQNSPKNSSGIGSKNNAKGDKMGSNTRANKQIDDVAKKHKIDRKEFGKHIESLKNKEGRKGADNYSWKELESLAKKYNEKK